MNKTGVFVLIGASVAIGIIYYILKRPKYIPIKFPRDEGAHPRAKQEWWYFNGHVFDEEYNSYGLMTCFFKNGDMYIAIADENNDTFYGGAIKGELIASQDKLDISIGENWWVAIDTFTYKMHTEHLNNYLNLDMVAEKPPLLIGGDGYVPMGYGGNSYYYSQTKLKVNGTLQIAGLNKTISGIGWIDRQWGSWSEEGYDGWEWFSIQLDNNVEINIFKLFDVETGESITPMLNIMYADNKQETLDYFEIEYLGFWYSPTSQKKFSHGWKIKIPERGTELTITPIITDQTIHPGLWEGSCSVTGTFKTSPVNGLAFVELTHGF